MNDTIDTIRKADILRDQKGDLRGAINLLEEQLKFLYEDPLLSFDLPLVLKKLANCHKDIGETEKAHELYIEALELARNDLNRIEEADILSSLAFWELKIGSIEKAMDYVKKALKYIGSKRGDKFAETKANTFAVLGNIYFENAEYDEALKNYRRALKTAENVKYEKRVITVISDIANVHIRNEHYGKAVKSLKKSILTAEGWYRIALPQLYFRLGRVFLNESKYKKAEEYFLKGLDIATKLGLPREMGEGNELLGDLYFKQGLKSSDFYYKKALESFNKGNYIIQMKFVKVKLKN